MTAEGNERMWVDREVHAHNGRYRANVSDPHPRQKCPRIITNCCFLILRSKYITVYITIIVSWTFLSREIPHSKQKCPWSPRSPDSSTLRSSLFRFWYFGFSTQQYFQSLRLTSFQHCPDSIRFFQIAHQSTLLYDLHIAVFDKPPHLSVRRFACLAH